MIRKIEEKDYNSVVDILYQVHKVHALGRPDLFKEGGVKYDYDSLVSLFDDPKNIAFVYEENDKVLGYIICMIKETEGSSTHNSYKTLFVDDLGVDENARGKGIARKLDEHIVKYAKDNGFDSITLNVYSFNKVAITVYEKSGYEVQKMIMEKSLR